MGQRRAPGQGGSGGRGGGDGGDGGSGAGRRQPGSCWPSRGRLGTRCSGLNFRSRGLPMNCAESWGGAPGKGRRKGAFPGRECLRVRFGSGWAGCWAEGRFSQGRRCGNWGKTRLFTGRRRRTQPRMWNACPHGRLLLPKASFFKSKTGRFRWNESFGTGTCHTKF